MCKTFPNDMSFRYFQTPDDCIDYLETLYNQAIVSQKEALRLYLDSGIPPGEEIRRTFCYPELCVLHEPKGGFKKIQRSYAKMTRKGVFRTTITHPKDFRIYLKEQLSLLSQDYEVSFAVSLSRQEIPYAYIIDQDDTIFEQAYATEDLSLYFPTPDLCDIGDEIADELFVSSLGEGWPLSLFDGARIDFSLKRLTHYTGTDWRNFQPWILLTNYHRYVDQFIHWAIEQLQHNSQWSHLILPGNLIFSAGDDPSLIQKIMAESPWNKFQMPAYHLCSKDGQGITLVNMGVGPANAKTITDHLAVLRPHCWLMIGHCGGLRQSQSIGDYVLAHAYLRRDRILDNLVPPDIPVPALAEVQTALQQATALVTGQQGSELKKRLRTGTVVTYDDRNWELRFSQERRSINLSRAIGVDMESGTIAAQGYRFRVPYGTLLCVSDKPLHGEIKLPGAASAFYQRSIGEHFLVGLKTIELLKEQLASLHSRKLRSFDEPPFR